MSENSSKIISLILALIILTCVLTTPPVSQGKTVSPLRLCKTISLENPAFSTFASDNESNESAVIFENNGTIKSFDLKTLELNWTSDIGGNFSEKPLISNQNIFFINYKNSSKKIYSISIRTGLTNWSRKIEQAFEKNEKNAGDQFENTKPSISHLDEKRMLLLNGRYIYILESSTGETIWRKESGIKVTDASLLGDRLFIVGYSDKFLLKMFFDKNNKKNAEEIPYISGQIRDAGEQIELEIVPEKIFPGKFANVYISDSAGRIYAYDNSLTDKFWKTRLGGRATSFLNTETGLLVTSLDNFVYMLSHNKGRILWKKRLGGRIDDLPLLLSDTLILYAHGSPEVVFLNVADGRTINKIILSAEQFLIDTPIFFDNRYFLLTNSSLSVYQTETCR